MGKVLLILRTLKYVKLIQVWNRIWRKFLPKGTRGFKGSTEPLGEFEFLNIKGNPKGWNDPRFEKLWLYNLHYFDYLNNKAEVEGRGGQWKLDLVHRWIKENPKGWGNGWEPYPISLRVVNWIKWLMRGEVKGRRLRERALESVDKWLSGVSHESFASELQKLLQEKEDVGDYRFKRHEDRQAAQAEAERFFEGFSRKIISLSDGRCVYFAPDERSRVRNGGNLSRCWAEYAFHAVSSSGRMLDGKSYRERLYNSLKARDMDCFERVLKAEQCMYRLIDAHPENDAVVFMGFDPELSRLEIVTRLDQFGNAQANLSEVTVIVKHSRPKESPPPKYRPLTEVVEAVAKHQAAGFSPSTTADTIANLGERRKGGGTKFERERRSIEDSLLEQVEWLEKRLECHLLANHLLANAKALVFAGKFLGNEKWYRKGMAIYRKELPEQTCADGVNFERSPMYHCIILEDLLDCYALLRLRPEVEAEKGLRGEFEEGMRLFKEYAEKMLAGLKMLTGPDGKISKFNDSTEGIALSPDQLLAYAKDLGAESASEPVREARTIRCSGYVRMEKGAYCVIAKCGDIGPSYQPGHAHADTFTFELWKSGRKIVGDTGCSTYVPGPIRSYERSTAAHNTVVIDGRNSSEVWAAHRVGRRFDKRTHLRSFELTEEGLKGVDEILGCGVHDLEVRFHLPPGVDEEDVKIVCSGVRRVEPCEFAVGWNKRESGRCIVYHVVAQCPTTVTWTVS